MKKSVKEMRRKLRELSYKHAPRKYKQKRAAKVAAELRKLFNNCPPAYVKDQPN